MLGYDLSRVDLETTIVAEEVTALPVYENLADGLNVESRDEALQRIDQIERDLRKAEGDGDGGGTGGGDGIGDGGGTGTGGGDGTGGQGP